ncbi:hypothetical protein [Dyella sp.]|jgi:hypothetical protein|uniref:hypothetical protein n=1 Tax=Dyella sp. TaxID=1869338 RepID=UPI002C30898F|nr:hypothetical protein [Dyella sp.]HTC25899.1 hypothetical protein [Dyella sp.]
MTKQSESNGWILGRLSVRGAVDRCVTEAFSPLMLALVAGFLIPHDSEKWKDVALNIIQGIWNVSLLKVSFGVALVVLPLAVALQVLSVENRFYWRMANFVRFLSGSIGSVAFTAASVVIGVIMALMVLSFREPDHTRAIRGTLWVVFIMLVTNAIIYGLCYLTYYPRDVFPIENKTWKRIGVLILLAFSFFGVYYLTVSEHFCEVSALPHTKGECASG